ncbi:uncharacterized protein PAC_08924 [Phialocephala subalpina]|uniref:Oxysterol-binding protein n=1 Tax=Phialocephala subalpina TaxID=576137 RepID=A0A1L7X1Z4_9HELO|nr:uncharacterized protein PAC_08924 [Phialocephala subalpina]
MSHQNLSLDGIESPPPYQTTTSLETSSEKTSGSGKNVDITCSAKGYEEGLRNYLKNILKSAIVQGLSTPVTFNEPLSQLQRHAEDLEYAELLNTAADLEDSAKRMIYVAVFVYSKYASASELYSKSFNPLLGETYEYVDPKKGYRFVSEQVSHHPPMLALWAESKRWTYHGEAETKNTIHLNSIEIDHAGTWFLTLRLADGTEELYTWKKPVATVKMHLVSGSPTIESYGPISVKNWTTGDVCTVDDFKISSGSEIHGKIVDGYGKPRAELSGNWNGTITGNALEKSEKMHKDDIKTLYSETPSMIWETNRQQLKKGDYTPFLAGLNDLSDRLKYFLPPTDTRLRPDQRALENGQHAIADIEKKRLEELQRKRQLRRSEDGLEYRPRWFSRRKCDVTGDVYSDFDGEYWREREKNKGERWRGLENIF